MNRDGTNLTLLINDQWVSVDLEPAWSPDGKKLVFVRQGDLWTMTIGDDNSFVAIDKITSATDYDAHDESPTWSPDGTQIAFVRRSIVSSWGSDICVVNQYGGVFTKLTNTPEREYEPEWHPGGQGLVYARRGPNGGEADIYVTFFNDFFSFTLNVLPDPWYSDTHPSFSPDGNWIAFERKSTAFSYGRKVYKVGLNGTGLQNLTGFIFDSMQSSARDPHWR